MNKIRSFVTILIFFLIIFIFTSCSKNEIIVYDTNTEIKQGIESYINKDDTTGVNIQLINKRNIDNIKIVSFSTNSTDSTDFGYAILENKDNAKYTIQSILFCTNAINHTVFKTHKGKYLLDTLSKYNINVKLIEKDNNYIF